MPRAVRLHVCSTWQYPLLYNGSKAWLKVERSRLVLGDRDTCRLVACDASPAAAWPRPLAFGQLDDARSQAAGFSPEAVSAPLFMQRPAFLRLQQSTPPEWPNSANEGCQSRACALAGRASRLLTKFAWTARIVGRIEASLGSTAVESVHGRSSRDDILFESVGGARATCWVLILPFLVGKRTRYSHYSRFRRRTDAL